MAALLSQIAALLLVLILSANAVPSATIHLAHGAPHSNGGQPSRNGDRPYSAPVSLLNWLKHRVFDSDRELYDTCKALGALKSPSDLPSGLYTSYADQLVTRFNVSTAEEAAALAAASSTLFLDIWSVASNHVDIHLGQDDLAPLLGLLPSSLQHAHQPLLRGIDLAYAIADTYPPPQKPTRIGSFERRRSSIHPAAMTEANDFFLQYRSLAILESWMHLLESLFPKVTQLIEVGQSWQGRRIHALRVGVYATDTHHSGPRKTIIVSGGSHAREWISTSTVAFVMYNLVAGYGRDSDVTALLGQIDFVFVPTLNPDGYVYSWEHDRLWRKSRQPGPIPFCHGIDIDRSWSFQWDADDTTASANPCSENYAGENAFHSVEASSFATWIRNETDNNSMEIMAMLDLHSYSQQILMPYAFSCSNQPANAEDLEEIAQGMAREIRRTNGEYFEVISACHGNVVPSRSGDTGERVLPRIQTAGGSPLDWFHHDMGVRYTYQIKVRDTGSYGFLLPPEYIVPAGKEIFNAVMFLGQSLTSEDAALSKPRFQQSGLKSASTPDEL